MHCLILAALTAVNLTGWLDGYTSGDWQYSYSQAEAELSEDSTCSDAWAALSLSATALGFTEQASEFASQAVDLDSRSAMAWAALGRSCIGDVEQSLLDFETALGYDPTFIPALVGKAHCLMIREEYSEAQGILAEALDIDSSWISIWVKMSEIQRYQYEFEKALESVNAALGEWPLNKQLLFEAAWLMELTGRYQTAEMVYRKIADTYPEDTGCLIDLGMLLEGQEQYGAAIKVYRELGRRDPESFWYLGEIGICLQLQGNYEASRASFLEGLQVNPQYAFAQYSLGLMDEDDGNTEEAMFWYDACTESDSTFLEAWIALGILYEDEGNYEAAETVYRTVLAIDPDYSWTWGELGLVLEYLGKMEEAGEAYESGVAVDSDYLWAWEQRGLLFEDEGDLEAAADWYIRATREASDPGVWIVGELGFILEQLGLADSASVYYRQAISFDSTYTFGYQRLAPITARSGNFDEALSLWDSYIDAGGFVRTAICERALIYESQGNDLLADSLKELISEEYPFAWVDLVWSYTLTNPEISLQLARKAEEECRTEDPYVWLQIAEAYIELEEIEAAGSIYETSSPPEYFLSLTLPLSTLVSTYNVTLNRLASLRFHSGSNPVSVIPLILVSA